MPSPESSSTTMSSHSIPASDSAASMRAASGAMFSASQKVGTTTVTGPSGCSLKWFIAGAPNDVWIRKRDVPRDVSSRLSGPPDHYRIPQARPIKSRRPLWMPLWPALLRVRPGREAIVSASRESGLRQSRVRSIQASSNLGGFQPRRQHLWMNSPNNLMTSIPAILPKAFSHGCAARHGLRTRCAPLRARRLGIDGFCSAPLATGGSSLGEIENGGCGAPYLWMLTSTGPAGPAAP